LGGVAEYHNQFYDEEPWRDVNLKFDWMNYQAFGIAGLSWNPLNTMLLRATLGAGYYESDVIADISMRNTWNTWNNLPPLPEDLSQWNVRDYLKTMGLKFTITDTTVNYQGRVDFDWDQGKGFLFAAGVQELYSQWIKNEKFHTEAEYYPLPGDENGSPFWNIPDSSTDVKNQGYC
jgi:hypothetical protein